MKSFPYIISAAALVVLFGCRKEQVETTGGPATASKPAAAKTASSSEANPFASYEAKTLDGKPYALSSLRGKPVLVNVWATWCPPCRHEIPDLIEFHRQWQPKGVEVVGVSIDDADALEDVKSFVSEHKMTYPVVFDPEGEMATLLKTSVIPTSAVLDRQGNLVWSRQGVVTAGDPELLAAIEKAMAAGRP